MKELAEKAAVAELGQHLSVAQDILGSADAPKVVAFLLKAYFNGQAGGDGRLRGAAAVLHEQDEAAARRGPAASAQANSAPDADADAEADGPTAGAQDTNAEPRPRRRRRGRGEAGAQAAPSAPNNDGAAPTPSRGRQPAFAGGSGPRKDAFEIIDAVDLLFPERRQALERERAAKGQERAANRPERDAKPEDRERPAPREGGREPRKPAAERSAKPERARGGAAPASQAEQLQAPAPGDVPAAPAGMMQFRVNIGFDDGFKGRGAVAKKIASLAGLNEGTVTELTSKRDHAILQASQEISEMVLDRVDGAPLGKKVISVQKI